MHLSAILLIASLALAQEGVPVSDSVVLAKCGGTCHARDERGNLDRISNARATPEGWQDVLKRMMRDHAVSISAAEARAIVKDLANNHGLTPEEAAAVRYGPERRIRTETNIPDDQMRNGCAKCHTFAVVLSWRRSAGEWKQFIEGHAARLKFPVNEGATAFLAKNAPLVTPEWTAWSGRAATAEVTGKWLVTASLPGRGKYWGEMTVERGSASGDLQARTRLTSMADGSTLERVTRGVIYGGSAWRGRSVGGPPPGAGAAVDDASSEAREVMTVSGATAEGRWFWGQYQEFGFDVRWVRDTGGAVALALDRVALKGGSKGNKVRILGAHFPAEGDLNFGAGVVVRAVVARTPGEIVALLDVAPEAALGRRDVVAYGSRLVGGLAVYDRVDYVKVTPDSAVASFSDATHPRGYLPFEAVGFQRGPDGRMHTEDDLELGPVEVKWGLQVFHDLAATERVGRVTAAGLFEPAMENPAQNFDVWVTATAVGEGKPLVGKAYLVVAPPTYTIGGRKYVRDLDRWVDEGNK